MNGVIVKRGLYLGFEFKAGDEYAISGGSICFKFREEYTTANLNYVFNFKGGDPLGSEVFNRLGQISTIIIEEDQDGIATYHFSFDRDAPIDGWTASGRATPERRTC